MTLSCNHDVESILCVLLYCSTLAIERKALLRTGKGTVEKLTRFEQKFFFLRGGREDSHAVMVQHAII